MRLLVTIFLNFALSHTYTHASKQTKEWVLELYNLKEKYITSDISTNQYMVTVDSIARLISVSNAKLDNEEFVRLLSLYRDAAWRKKRYYKYRPAYYIILANNAMLNNNLGEALFYAKQNEIENELLGNKEFAAQYLQLRLLRRTHDYDGVKNLFNKEIDHIRSFIDEEVDDKTILRNIQAIQFIQMAIRPLVINGHSELAQEGIAIAKDILDKAYENQHKLSSDILLNRTKSIIYYADLDFYIESKDTIHESRTIQEFENFMLSEDLNVGVYEKPFWKNYHLYLIEYHIKNKNIEKAQEHLHLLEKEEHAVSPARLANYNSQISAISGDQQQSYSYIESAIELKNKEYQSTYSEITDLLYSYIEEEYDQMMLEYSQTKGEKQKALIYTAGLLAFLAVTIFITLLIKDKKKSKKKIQELNEFAQFAIEETRSHTILEEQKKLGQELHDDFSGSLASVLHLVDSLSNKTESSPTKEKLLDLRGNINDIYIAIKNKTHEIYHSTSANNTTQFKENITQFIQTAFNKKDYDLSIDIEDQAVNQLKLGHRVELLRILQGSISNIIRHSKATEVSLLLYKGADQVIFQISDNGIGINNSMGFGLKSIQQRAQDLGGQLEIIADEGTTLIVNIPCQMDVAV